MRIMQISSFKGRLHLITFTTFAINVLEYRKYCGFFHLLYYFLFTSLKKWRVKKFLQIPKKKKKNCKLLLNIDCRSNVEYQHEVFVKINIKKITYRVCGQYMLKTHKFFHCAQIH